MLYFEGEKNPGDKLISLPFFQATVDDLRPRESLRVEYFFIFLLGLKEIRMKIINLFVCLFFEEEKIHGTNKFLCPFFKQQLMPFARGNLITLNFFIFLLAHKEKEFGKINLNLCLILRRKNPGDKLISLPFFRATGDDLRPRESLLVEYFFIFL